MKTFLAFMILIAFQRLSELLIARRNERTLRSEGAVEYDAPGYKAIVLMHIAFFVSMIAEFFILGRSLNPYWIPLLFIFTAAQIIRYWAISSLGKYWNTRILAVPGAKPVTKGPYKYMRHPNYLAVIIEIAVIPLIFSCYVTAIVFSILNLMLLRRRITIEERALGSDSLQKR